MQEGDRGIHCAQSVELRCALLGDTCGVIEEKGGWKPLLAGVHKINVDGSYSANSDYAAIGVICRDSTGSFQWGFVDKLKSLSAFMTEALGLKRALMLVIHHGHDKVGFSLLFTPRQGNGAADFLAVVAFKEVYPIRWLFEPTLLFPLF
ncbi:uncharacterized protein LOC129312814 isoform X2 [Prosopis cineraria]|uniref:uncharacterized protein LOC129312814 isoform X2 n=1 Tax=Prosopis cineraria TaxID=364024 RepID=UPI002410AE8E|nr:uncharacterized protein LOC129312814 isoform X2 [Prosopis cineraria]